MALNQSDLDKIDAAIANTNEEVHQADRMVRKRTIQEEILARNIVAGEIAKTSGVKIVRHLRVVSDQGW